MKRAKAKRRSVQAQIARATKSALVKLPEAHAAEIEALKRAHAADVATIERTYSGQLGLLHVAAKELDAHGVGLRDRSILERINLLVLMRDSALQKVEVLGACVNDLRKVRTPQ